MMIGCATGSACLARFFRASRFRVTGSKSISPTASATKPEAAAEKTADARLQRQATEPNGSRVKG